MTDAPDDVTALIAATLVRAHAAPKATPEQLASRTAGFLPTATQVRDALASAGLVTAEAATALKVMNLEHVRRVIQNAIERMTVTEREKWELIGYYRGRSEVVQGVSDDRLLALLGDVAGALELALSAPIPTEKRETCERILARAKEALT